MTSLRIIIFLYYRTFKFLFVFYFNLTIMNNTSCIIYLYFHICTI